jgi:hypothetical protein
MLITGADQSSINLRGIKSFDLKLYFGVFWGRLMMVYTMMAIIHKSSLVKSVPRLGFCAYYIFSECFWDCCLFIFFFLRLAGIRTFSDLLEELMEFFIQNIYPLWDWLRLC